MLHSTHTVTVCRCGVGYIPQEAHQSAALTTAADIYQFGGLCYNMATGLHPLLLADATPLPDYMPEQWRLMVSLCQTAKPVDRPTLAQLQLHLHGLCQRAPTSIQLPAKSAPAVPIWVSLHGRSQELPAFAVSQEGLYASEAAASGSSAVLPRMAANSPFLPSTARAQTRTAERKAAARVAHPPASTQRASAVAEQGLGLTISVPRLMLGVHQWLPEKSIRCVDHTQSSHHAASGSQQSSVRLDADMAGSTAAVLQLPSPGQDISNAASVPMSNAFIGKVYSADSTQAGCAEQRSAASGILRAVAYSHTATTRLTGLGRTCQS